MIDEATIATAVRLLHSAAPEALVILVGSYARGNATEQSDLDLLVVKQCIGHRRMETSRLKAIARRAGVDVDVLVTDQQTFDQWCHTPGMIHHMPPCASRPFPAIDFGISVPQFRADQIHNSKPSTNI
jgi:predicted nucleotidyltransferase